MISETNKMALSPWKPLIGQKVRRIPRLKNTINERIKVATANIGTLRGRRREIVEMLTRRKVDICCLQEVRYKNEGCITFGSGDQKYKLWYAGNDQSSNGVGIMMKQGLAESLK